MLCSIRHEGEWPRDTVLPQCTYLGIEWCVPYRSHECCVISGRSRIKGGSDLTECAQSAREIFKPRPLVR